jgi:carboxyl-terminal processing protease
MVEAGFVGIDTTLYSNVIDSLYAKNILNRYVYQYYLEHKNEFSKYASADAFAKAYTVTDAVVADLLQYAKQDSVIITGISQREKDWIRGRIKLLLARQLWRTEGFFQISNSDDPAVRKALEVVSD